MVLTALLAGAAITSAIVSPAEWGLHKYILHAPPKRRTTRLVQRAAIAHNDEHHGAFKSPHHYYRDVTNEHITVHFGKKDVGLIAAIVGGVGASIHATYQLVSTGEIEPTPGGAAFVGGMLAVAMGYYATYEFTHHYMHVIGERRMAINREFGNLLQGREPDGELRFPKPVLDNLCNRIEDVIDGASSSILDPIIPAIEQYLKYNTGFYQREDVGNVIAETADAVGIIEQAHISGLSPKKRRRYKIDRWIQRRLRHSRAFEYIDNHHFLHHVHYMHNLNVVFPGMDILMGTKKDSSIPKLLEEQRYWLCPNSPDTEKFPKKR